MSIRLLRSRAPNHIQAPSDPGHTYTWAAWLYWEDLHPGWGTDWTNLSCRSSDASDDTPEIERDTDNQVGRLVYWHNAGSGTPGTTGAIRPGVWTHIAVTRPGASGTSTIWVNGKAAATNTVDAHTAANIAWGGYSLAGSDNMSGRMAHLRLWTAALSEAEIIAEMKSATVVKTASLWGDWPLLDDANDDSGNGRNLTVTGTAEYVAQPTMGAIQWIGTSTWSTTAGSSVSFAMPQGAAVGDLLVVFFNAEQASTGRSVSSWGQDNGNWNSIVNQFSSGQAVQGMVFWNTIDGSAINATQSITATLSASDEYSGVMMVFRNTSLTAPFTSITSAGPGTSGPAVADAKSSLSTSQWVIFGAASAYGTTWTPPSGWTEIADHRSGTGTNNTSLAVCFRTDGTSTGADTYNAATNDYWIEWTAVLNLAATGVSGSATGAVSLAGTATGTVAVAGSATGALALAGSAAATISLTGSGSGALILAGTGTGASAVSGVGSGFLTLAGTGAGTVADVTITGSATGVLTLTGSATGTVAIAATATGGLALAGTSAGTIAIAASASGSPALAGAGSGTVAVNATATGTLALNGTATGTLSLNGTATGAFALNGAASGSVGSTPIEGTASGALSFMGSASGVVAITAAATGSLPISGAAAGTVAVLGAASGALAFAGTNTAVVTVTGSGAGVLALDGTATGAVGAIPIVGEGAGILPLAGAAAGTIALVASASSVLILAGTGSAVIPVTGTGSGVLAIAGTAMGGSEFTAITGAGAGTLDLSGSGAGVAPVTGSATTALALAGAATGAVLIQATAAGVLTLTGAGVAAIITFVLVTVAGSVTGPRASGAVQGARATASVMGPQSTGAVQGMADDGEIKGPKSTGSVGG